MIDWTEGYVTDISYTYGYYSELNPRRVKLAFLNAGLVCPEFSTACELGFGQGLSANIHAAASDIEWYGTDFSPAQAAFAQESGVASGSNAKLYDDSFLDFTHRTDLPDFDYIGVHGIWSWITEQNQKIIVEFIHRKLKPGGVLYISYNTMPGWAAFAPIRELLVQHNVVMGASGEKIDNRFDSALAFTETLMAQNPLYLQANPSVLQRVQNLKKLSRNYLVHEYFNQNWHTVSFHKALESLAPAKVDYACSANYFDHIDALNLTIEQRKYLNTIPDAMFRQSVRDFMVNQQFRKDYWVKGARRLSALEQAEEMRLQKVILVSNPQQVALKINGALGLSDLNEKIYNPILDFLADYKQKTIAQIEQAVTEKEMTFAQVTEAITVLTGAGHIAAVQEDDVIRKSRKHTDKLNSFLIKKARSSSDISFLASPVIGGGVAVGRFQQLFLLALSQAKKQPTEWAQFVWQILTAQGQKIVKEGKTLETPEQNLAELLEQAIIFAEQQLPILKALQVV